MMCNPPQNAMIACMLIPPYYSTRSHLYNSSRILLYQNAPKLRPPPTTPLQLFPLHQEPIHNPCQNLAAQTQPLDARKTLGIYRFTLASTVRAADVEEAQDQTCEDDNYSRCGSVGDDEVG